MTTTKQTISHLIESNNIFICDFNDSFTFNLYSDLTKLNQSVVIRSFSDKSFWNQLKLKKEKFILVLGPGPGHPKEYDFSNYESFFGNEKCFVLGICLGHQLIMKLFGAITTPSSNKAHGQQVEIIDRSGSIFSRGFNSKFQRYNSLTSDVSNLNISNAKLLFDASDELMVYKSDRVLSCQFHPESVGTNCPNSIYSIALEFLL